ncbi:MAG: hypothetical protein EZS28_013115, partial [Streblomastix strix]
HRDDSEEGRSRKRARMDEEPKKTIRTVFAEDENE